MSIISFIPPQKLLYLPQKISGNAPEMLLNILVSQCHIETIPFQQLETTFRKR